MVSVHKFFLHVFNHNLKGIYCLNGIRTKMDTGQRKWCVNVNVPHVNKMCKFVL